MQEIMKQAVYLFTRYIFLLIIAIPNLYLFYLILTPLTLYSSYFLFNLIYDASLSNNIINIGCTSIEIIGACVSGAAYYFLLVLNFSTRDIKPKTRIKMLIFSFGIFFILNIIRIFIIGTMHINFNPNTQIFHKVLWYLGSTIIVVAIWFFNVWFFKIKNMPFYSDLKFLFQQSSLKNLLSFKRK